jgi:hypothetical protein
MGEPHKAVGLGVDAIINFPSVRAQYGIFGPSIVIPDPQFPIFPLQLEVRIMAGAQSEFEIDKNERNKN